VNAAQTEAELESIRRSVQRGQPYGGEAWIERTAKRLGLTSTLRPIGRPKSTKESKKKGSAGSARRSRAAPPTDPDVPN